jgi:hypothetical protein
MDLVAFSLFLVTPWLDGPLTGWEEAKRHVRRHGLVERLLFYAFFFFALTQYTIGSRAGPVRSLQPTSLQALVPERS